VVENTEPYKEIHINIRSGLPRLENQKKGKAGKKKKSEEGGLSKAENHEPSTNSI